jgi:hypothetical protein
MALILDASALIATERGDVRVAALLHEAQRGQVPVRTSSAVVAQVWRGGGRQARLACVLSTTDEWALDAARSRSIGRLLAAAGADDVIDASVVDMAVEGDEILTGDTGDIQALVSAAGRRITLISL